MRRLISITMLILLFAACEKPADIDIPYAGDKIVLNTMMQADSVMYIRVTQSLPPGANTFPELTTASVKVYENDVPMSVTHKVINGVGYFVSAKPVQRGNRYTVQAAYTGLDAAMASDTLPVVASVEDVHGYAGGSRLRFVINDRPGMPDYYRLRIYRADSSSGKPVPVSPLFFRFDPSYNNEFVNVINQRYYTTNIISDEKFDGLRVTMVMQTQEVLPAGQYLVMEVTTLTADAYKYLKTLDLQEVNDGNILIEPSRVYTNVTGGYGIVGGINSNRIPFKAN